MAELGGPDLDLTALAARLRRALQPLFVDRDEVSFVAAELDRIARPAVARTDRRTDVGRCGDRPRLPRYATGMPMCELDAGHPGMHRDGTMEWGSAARTDGQPPADMPDEFGPYLRSAMQRPEFRQALDDVQVRDELRSAAWEAFQHPTGFDDGDPRNVQEAVEVAADAVLDLLVERSAAAPADDTAAPDPVTAELRMPPPDYRSIVPPGTDVQAKPPAAPADDTAAPATTDDDLALLTSAATLLRSVGRSMPGGGGAVDLADLIVAYRDRVGQPVRGSQPEATDG